jgi:hypothetical protein
MRTAVLLGLALVVLAPQVAQGAARRTYSIVIGYNGVPGGEEHEGLEGLQYADDDAVAVHQFVGELGGRSILLSTLDPDTQRRVPALPAQARPPSLAELRRAVEEVRRLILAEKEADTTVLFFYSGHGSRTATGSSLTLADGKLSHRVLYEEVLARLPATAIHVVIDACHAEAVVHPRDAQAVAVDVDPTAMDGWTKEHTLARYPNVGAIMASTAGAEAHEWNVYQGGIFTHELISGLRGAADVDGDGRIEYSELGAFLAAANRAVTDPRARLHTVVVPPRLDPRRAIVVLEDAPHSARLRGRPAPLGAFYVEDARGQRLADVHAESGARVALVVPPDQSLYVRTVAGESELRLAAGEVGVLDSLQLSPQNMRPRGALESALRRGLFATPFGPAYYRGHVDNLPNLPPVDVAIESQGGRSEEVGVAVRDVRERDGRTVAKWTAVTSTGGLAVASAWFAKEALDAHHEYEDPMLVERQAPAVASRYRRDGLAAAFLGVGALLSAAVAYVVWR